MDIEAIAPLTVQAYCREIRELAAQVQATELPTAQSFELERDGQIRWTEAWQRSDMHRFVVFPEEYTAQIFAAKACQ
jgi:hypothetical protein